MNAARLLVGAACVALSACGGAQSHARSFSTDWEDDGGASIEAVRVRLAGAKATLAADVAVGVAGNSDKLVGLPLGGGAKWTFAHAIETRPVIAGGVVVSQGAGEVFAVDAQTGARLWARPAAGLVLRGAGDDGTYTVVTLGSTGGSGSTLLALDRQGNVVQKVETERSLGAPAVIKGLAFVPWGQQYVSVYDIDKGAEVGRALVRGKVSQALASGGGVYFGEVELFRFDEAIKTSSRGGATKLPIPRRELPGATALMRSPEERVGPVAMAVDKTRMYVRPGAIDAPAALDSSRLYANYFRLTMAFDTTTSGLAWVHSSAVDVIGGAAASGGFALCDEQGKVEILDAATGATTAELAMGEPLKSCVVSADGLRPGAAKSPALPLSAQLSAALTSNDPELVAAQALLMRELATSPDEGATRTLIDIASNPRSPPILVAEARKALPARRNGARAMIEALGRRYDFLRDVLRAPPVGPIAQALSAMKDKSAAAALASHLVDPADTDDDVKQTTAALIEIGDAPQVGALKEFFGLYRASAEGEELSQAAVNAGHALLKFGGTEGRKVVDAALADAMTGAMVKSRLAAVEQSLDAEKALAKDKAKAGEKTKDDAGKKPAK